MRCLPIYFNHYVPGFPALGNCTCVAHFRVPHLWQQNRTIKNYQLLDFWSLSALPNGNAAMYSTVQECDASKAASWFAAWPIPAIFQLYMPLTFPPFYKWPDSTEYFAGAHAHNLPFSFLPGAEIRHSRQGALRK